MLATLLVVAALVTSQVLALPVPEPDPAKLLRVPKVYNALITSDEPLLPSRTEQATVGQVLYYPRHAGYPASSGPLPVPLVVQGQQVYQQAAGSDSQGYDAVQLVSQQQPNNAQYYEQGPDAAPAQVQAAQAQQSPVAYASDPAASSAGLEPQDSPVVYADPAPPPPGPPAAPRRAPLTQQQERDADRDSLTYQPPPSVDIDSIKNNRPVGIRDVPPPPLPAGRRATARPQAIPPGIIPF